MILTIDVGNTNIVIGLFQENELLRRWRISTDHSKTVDEYRIILDALFRTSEGDEKRKINGAVISSVVPPLTGAFAELIKDAFGIKPVMVGPGIKTGISILYENQKEVGADRIANAVGAFQKYKSACIVVDFGTATTFDYITEKGEYLGGIIAPGVIISAEALFMRTAKLPKVEISEPSAVVGRNTVESIQSGLIHGHRCMVEGLVKKISEEQKTRPKVIATGGLASIIAKGMKCIDIVDDNLTLWGLYFIYQFNRGRKTSSKEGGG